MDAKTLFKLIYREARRLDNGSEHPYFLADYALRCLDHAGVVNALNVIERKIDGAVLFAIFWNRRQDPAEKRPLWASNRRIAFVANAEGTRQWFEPPRLPA